MLGERLNFRSALVPLYIILSRGFYFCVYLYNYHLEPKHFWNANRISLPLKAEINLSTRTYNWSPLWFDIQLIYIAFPDWQS